MDDCFLCKEGTCFLMYAGDTGDCRVYCSIRPDLDPESKKPLHVLVAPKKHFASVSEMPRGDYLRFMNAVQQVKNFYLSRGYGPAVTILILEPGPHSPHPHAHLVFSSNPLRPLKEEKRDLVEEDFLDGLKREAEALQKKNCPRCRGTTKGNRTHQYQRCHPKT